ncbi:MAG: hypothetical protein IKZ82_13710 [Clostridia bacterium]|nr:hypothetical protein [Clostridia bacterium]
MLHPAEAEFLRRFIVKNKRNRLLFELSDEGRRAQAVDRFSHNAEELLLLDKAVLSGGKLSIEQIVSSLKENSSGGECHAVLSDGGTIDTGIEEAVKAVYGDGPAIVITQGTVYIETEPWTPTARYVLACKTE